MVTSSETYLTGTRVKVGLGRLARGWFRGCPLVHLQRCVHYWTLTGCEKAVRWQLGFRCEDCYYLQIRPIFSPHRQPPFPTETLQVIREEPVSPGLSMVSPGTIYVVWFSLRKPQIVVFKNPACPEDRCGKSWPSLWDATKVQYGKHFGYLRTTSTNIQPRVKESEKAF